MSDTPRRPHIFADLRAADRMIARVEILALVVLITGLVLLYVTNIVLRVGWRMNIAWLETLLKPAVLWIGLIGASLATRESRHISVEAVSKFSDAKSARVIAFFVNLFAGVVVLLLAIVALLFFLDAADESPDFETGRERMTEVFAHLDSAAVLLDAAPEGEVERAWLRALEKENTRALDALALAESELKPQPKVFADVLYLDLPNSGPFPESWLDVEKTTFEIGYRVRKWQVFVILPISLFIMAFRFFLHLLDGVGTGPGSRLGRWADAFDRGLAVHDKGEAEKPDDGEGAAEDEPPGAPAEASPLDTGAPDGAENERADASAPGTEGEGSADAPPQTDGGADASDATEEDAR